MDSRVKDIFHKLRKDGNKAVHEFTFGDYKQALLDLRLAHKLSIWYHYTFGEEKEYKEEAFVLPEDPSEKLQKLETEKEILSAKLIEANLVSEESRELTVLVKKETREREALLSEMHASTVHYEKIITEREAELERTKKLFEAKIQAVIAEEKIKKKRRNFNNHLKEKLKCSE